MASLLPKVITHCLQNCYQILTFLLRFPSYNRANEPSSPMAEEVTLKEVARFVLRALYLLLKQASETSARSGARRTRGGPGRRRPAKRRVQEQRGRGVGRPTRPSGKM